MEVLLEGAGGELAGGGRGLGSCTQVSSQLRPGTLIIILGNSGPGQEVAPVSVI